MKVKYQVVEFTNKEVGIREIVNGQLKRVLWLKPGDFLDPDSAKA